MLTVDKLNVSSPHSTRAPDRVKGTRTATNTERENNSIPIGGRPQRLRSTKFYPQSPHSTRSRAEGTALTTDKILNVMRHARRSGMWKFDLAVTRAMLLGLQPNGRNEKNVGVMIGSSLLPVQQPS